MANLYEYFVRDGARSLITQQPWAITDTEGKTYGEIIARLHLDFEAGAKYVSFYIPEMPGVDCPEALAIGKMAVALSWPETELEVQAGIGGERYNARDHVFTGRIYLYSERPVNRCQSAPNRRGFSRGPPPDLQECAIYGRAKQMGEASGIHLP